MTPSCLVVLLHGVGSDAASLEPLRRAIAAAVPHADVVAPDGFHAFDGGPTGRQWFSIQGVTDANRPARVRGAAAEVSRWLDAELARRGLAGDRLVLGGFSQGGILTAWLAVHRDPRPAAAVVMSGRFADDATPVAGAPTPILVAHGADDRMMPLAVVEAGARALAAWGARVETRIYPGLGHGVDPRELADVRDFIATHAR